MTFSIDGHALMDFMMHAAGRRVRDLKISFRGRQGWSKDIGHYRKETGGKIIYRRFWLGHDRSRAAWLASMITDHHEQLVKSSGEGLWTVEHFRAIKLIVDVSDDKTRRRATELQEQLASLAARPPVPDLPQLPPAPVAAKTSPKLSSKSDAPQTPAMLYGAIEVYLKSLAGKRVSEAHLHERGGAWHPSRLALPPESRSVADSLGWLWRSGWRASIRQRMRAVPPH